MERSNDLELIHHHAGGKGGVGDPAPDRGELVFSPFPGETPLRHEAHIWLESAEARLAAKGLLTVANGGQYAAARQIVDIPLNDLPALPAEHRDYERRNEVRIRIGIENQKNAEKRYELTMRAWTVVYSA